jgi:hypothetical protein
VCTVEFAIAATVASTGISLIGGIQQSRAAQQQASFQAAVARNNAILAQRAAKDARARGKVEAGKQALATRQLIGRQKVVQAALGQEVGTGSALDLRVDAAAAGKLEELIIRNNAEREAIGFLTQGASFIAEAQLADLRRRSARRAGTLDLLDTIITGAGTISKKFRRVPSFDFAGGGGGPLV